MAAKSGHSKGSDEKQIAALVEAEVKKQLEPITNRLDAMESHSATFLDPNGPIEPTPNVVANPDPLATPQGFGTNPGNAGNQLNEVEP